MATREGLLAETFLQLADTIVDDFDVIELLTMLSGRCVDLLAAEASGILLVDTNGALQVVAASSETATLLELFQLQHEEGPCLDAFRSGRAVFRSDLAAESPWPSFSRAALAAGLRSVHAFPLRLRETVLGTLNLFMTEARPLTEADVIVAEAFAGAATIALLQDRAVSNLQQVNAQLQGALDSRVVIEQAKGTIAERAGIGMDAAFERLRTYARDRSAKLTAVAVAVVSHTLTEDEIADLLGTD
jgi:GAF domain-containing protein